MFLLALRQAPSISPEDLFKDDDNDDENFMPNLRPLFDDIVIAGEEDGDSNDQEEELPLALQVPNEIWLPMVERFFDLETLTSFIHVCRRFYTIGTDASAIAHVYLRRVAQAVLNGNYTQALMLNWQGTFRALWGLNLITPEIAAPLRQLLDINHFRPEYLPQALNFMNEEILIYPDLAPAPQRFLRRLWTQGALLFRAESEPSGMFLRELTGACNTLPEVAITSTAVQQLLAILSERDRNPQIHITAIHALSILFMNNALSDKEMEGVLTTLLRIITQEHYKSPIVLAASKTMQTLLLCNVLTDIRREAVLQTIVRVILSPRTHLERRIQLMHTLDIDVLAPVLTPRLRAVFLECLPIFIRNDNLQDLAQARLIQILRHNLLDADELAELGNRLHPLVTHESEHMRARMVHILTEAILSTDLDLTFRKACIATLRNLFKDSSIIVAEAIFENLVQIYNFHEDDVPLPLIYDGLMRLLICRNSLIAEAAVELLKRFHTEMGVNKLLLTL